MPAKGIRYRPYSGTHGATGGASRGPDIARCAFKTSTQIQRTETCTAFRAPFSARSCATRTALASCGTEVPWKLKRPCRQRGCPRLIYEGYCEEHRRPYTTGTTAQRGYGGRWQRLRLLVLNREPLCRMCHAPATDVDHFIPKSRGGDDSFDNLQSLCHECHARKTLIHDEGWGRTAS
jgi:5-methylcytosine-specific restriction protein A